MKDLIQEQALLSPSEVDVEHLVCSKCHKQNLLIIGKVFRNYVREVKNGIVTKYSTDDSELLETIDEYICLDCNLKHTVITEHTKYLMEGSEEFLSIIEE